MHSWEYKVTDSLRYDQLQGYEVCAICGAERHRVPTRGADVYYNAIGRLCSGPPECRQPEKYRLSYWEKSRLSNDNR